MTRRDLIYLAPAAFASQVADAAWWSIAQAGAALRARKISVTELAQASLERIAKLNPQLKAFITVTSEKALRDAAVLQRELERGRVRGPLHGVPVGLKDLLDTAGVRTTSGSLVFENRVPAADAPAVARLRAAGAVIVGKCNMDEFAYNFTGESSAYGIAKNPWNTSLFPGGSSGGSAVAVASGMCLAAVGSDTGGSIREPASLCGITGLKATYGAVSTRGATPLAWSLDHIGPMCRTAEDAAFMLQAMARFDPEDPASVRTPAGWLNGWRNVPIARLRVGVARKPFFEGLDRDVENTVTAAIGTIAKLTTPPRDVDLPAGPAGVLIRTEASAWHSPLLESSASKYQPFIRKQLEEGLKIPGSSYAAARRQLDLLRLDVARMFENVDIVLTPTVPREAGLIDPGREPDLIYLRNAIPFNLFGIPAISIPCGFTRSGMPVGLQIAGGRLREDNVIALAAAYQRETDWHTRRPPLNER